MSTQAAADALMADHTHLDPAHVDACSFEPVDVLVAAPDRRPFGRQGKAWSDDKTVATLFTFKLIASLQPLVAVVELVAPVLTLHEGAVWTLIEAVAELAGYKMRHTQLDTSNFVPMQRRILFVTLTRVDVADSWGTAVVPSQSVARADRVQLADLMVPLADARHAVIRSDTTIAWDQNARDTCPPIGKPVQVGYAASNTVGNRIFIGATPATKVGSFGLGGHSHLVAQRDPVTGQWHARQLLLCEVLPQFASDVGSIRLSTDPERAWRQLAMSTPEMLWEHAASHITTFLRPTCSRLPDSVDQLIPRRMVHAYRAGLQALHYDFLQMQKAG